MPDEKDVLLGKLAIHNKLLDMERVQECLKIQAVLSSVGMNIPLARILLHKRYLTQDKCEVLAKGVTAKLALAEPYTLWPLPEDKMNVLDQGIKQNLILTPAEKNKAILVKEKAEAIGVKLSYAEIAVGMNLLDDENLNSAITRASKRLSAGTSRAEVDARAQFSKLYEQTGLKENEEADARHSSRTQRKTIEQLVKVQSEAAALDDEARAAQAVVASSKRRWLWVPIILVVLAIPTFLVIFLIMGDQLPRHEVHKREGGAKVTIVGIVPQPFGNDRSVLAAPHVFWSRKDKSGATWVFHEGTWMPRAEAPKALYQEGFYVQIRQYFTNPVTGKPSTSESTMLATRYEPLEHYVYAVGKQKDMKVAALLGAELGKRRNALNKALKEGKRNPDAELWVKVKCTLRPIPNGGKKSLFREPDSVGYQFELEEGGLEILTSAPGPVGEFARLGEITYRDKETAIAAFKAKMADFDEKLGTGFLSEAEAKANAAADANAASTEEGAATPADSQ
jgi:hypothetical protein